jgi:N-acetylmuramoyl-L-alanine amidase
MEEINNSEQKVIVIDVGHGRVPASQNARQWDPGTHGVIDGKTVYEYQLNLLVAESYRTELEKRGYKVILTTDEGARPNPVPTDENFASRFDVACSNDADAYISVHANWFPSKSISGAYIYVAPQPSEDSEQLAQNALQSLKDHGIKVEPQVRNLLDETNCNGNTRAINCGPLKGLELSNEGIPCYLVETGCMSNAQDLRNLYKDAAYRQKFVSALADGLDEYFIQQEKIRQQELIALEEVKKEAVATVDTNNFVTTASEPELVPLTPEILGKILADTIANGTFHEKTVANLAELQKLKKSPAVGQ